MLRINRNSGRRGCDGEYRTWETIEQLYKETYEREILDALKEQRKYVRGEARRGFWDLCIKETPTWLLAKPNDLQKAVELIDDEYKLLSEKDKKYLLDRLGKAYGYEHSNLLKLANWLDLKTCPYCNMQYTLYSVEDEVEGAPSEEKAVFQFDHYIPQTKYPMFSMSLYNLIPSCASCNNSKRTTIFSPEYHPYNKEIKSVISFLVRNPLPLMVGREKDFEIMTIHPHGEEWNKFEKATHLAALVKRHQDVACEVFARAYESVYYHDAENFRDLGDDPKFKERLKMGFYPDEEDVDTRPLTKLQQDLWEQAKKCMGY